MPHASTLQRDGKVLAATDVKKNAKVHVRLIQDGDRTVVDKIYMEDAQFIHNAE